MSKAEESTKEMVSANSMFSDKLPTHINQESSRGQENVTMDDMTIPRLDILQDLSPQVKKRDPSYIDGAEPGMLYNTVSQKLYGNRVAFIPVYFKVEWLIWKQQNAGGGFCGAFNSESDALDEFEKQGYGNETYKTSSGSVEPAYEIVDTAQHYGMVVNEDGSIEQIVCSMSKSKMRISRQLNSLVKMAGGDRFSRAYEISSFPDQNSQNQEFWNIRVKALGYVPEKLYKEAEKMYDMIAAGQHRVAN